MSKLHFENSHRSLSTGEYLQNPLLAVSTISFELREYLQNNMVCENPRHDAKLNPYIDQTTLDDNSPRLI
jgi:hypothetical protein